MINLKRALLASTAIVAVASFAGPAFAAGEFAVDENNSNDGVYETDVDTALDLTTYTGHDIRFDGDAAAITADNGEVIGDGDDDQDALVAAAGANGDTLTISNGTANTNATVTVNGDIDNGAAAGFNLTLAAIADAGGASETLTLDVNGVTDLGTGTLTIVSNDDGATVNTATYRASGNITAGAIVLDADLNSGGAVSDASLTLDGTSIQTITGTINGGAAGDGRINITGAGAIFNSAIGGTADIGDILISNNTAGSTVTFKAAVGVDAASGIVIGDGGGTADAYTVVFDGSTAGFTVDGTVIGAATDTATVRVIGGNTIVQSDAWGGTLIESLVISGTGTTLDSNAAITVTNATVGSGATLDVGAGLFTGAIANSGTLTLSGTGGVTGNITGTGNTNVNANASITGNITQSTITVDDAADLTIVGAASRVVNANIVLDDAASNGTDAELIFDNGANTTTVNGNITVDIDGEGVITFADDAGAVLVLNGDVGTSDVAVGTLAVAGAGAQTLRTTGNLYVDTLTINDADTLDFRGDGVSQVVSGAITGGIVTVGTGTTATNVTFNSTLTSMVTGNIAAGAMATYGGNATFASTYTNDGTTQVNRGVTLATDSVVDATAGQFNIQVGRAAGTQNFGIITEANDDVDLTGDTVHFVVSTLQPLVAGNLNNVFTGNAASDVDGAIVTDNSFLYGFTLVEEGNNVDVTLAQENTIEDAVGDAYSDVGNVLLSDLATSTDADINAAQAALLSASTAEEVQDVLETVSPPADGGAILAGFDVSVQALDVTDTRLASLRTGNETGMVAGEMGQGVTAWIQGFGQLASQDERSGVDGYEADTLGIAVGVDTQNIHDNATVGVALSYAVTDVESDSASSTETDVDSYQISLYGDYDLDQYTYLEGMLGYAHNNIEQDRNNVGFTGATASADYDSDQFIAYAEAGRDFAVAERTVLTPSILAHYQHIAVDDYSETGAGGLSLDVDNEDLNILQVGVGAELGWDLDAGNGGVIRPALNAGYRYDLINDEVQATSTFTAGGPSFETNGLEPSRHTFNVGASVTFANTNNWEFTADYDFEYKPDYDAHSGYVRAGYKF